MSLRILFFGMPDHGMPFLNGLLVNGKHNIVGVIVPARGKVTVRGPHAWLQQMRRAFEKWNPRPGTTQDLARRARLPIWDKGLATPAFTAFVTRLFPDLFVVASFNRILKTQTLSLAPRGVINVHPSLLPQYRGADPIFWSILNRERTTGITVHWMDESLDTGPILAQREIAIPEDADSASLMESLTRAGVELLAEALDQIESGTASRRSQDERNASYFPPASKDFRTIHWGDCAETIMRLVRASTSYGGALALLEDHQVKILKAQEIERSPQLMPGKVLRYQDKWIEVSCRDAILRLFLAGGAA